MPDHATLVFALRHGETEWNQATRIQGHTDIALNPRGRWQAARLGQALADAGLGVVYSSDLARAHATAEAVARQAQAPLVRDTGLRERHFGAFEGLTFAEIEQRWPEEARRWRQRDPHFAPEGGESLQQFHSRCVDAARRLAAAHPGETIALVAHGGVLDCLYRAATRVDLQAPRTWELGNARINRLLFSDGDFTLVGWNDDGHLASASLDEPAP